MVRFHGSHPPERCLSFHGSLKTPNMSYHAGFCRVRPADVEPMMALRSSFVHESSSVQHRRRKLLLPTATATFAVAALPLLLQVAVRTVMVSRR